MRQRWIVGAFLGAIALAAPAAAQQLIAKARIGQTPALERMPALAALGITDIRPALAVQPADADLAARIGLDRYYALSLQPGLDPAAIAAAVPQFVDSFEHVEPVRFGTVASGGPADPLFPQQWHLRNAGAPPVCPPGPSGSTPVLPATHDINALAAWELRTRAPGIRVAILDSGINQHADLPPLLPGWTFDGGSTADQCNHGTHVAGIFGARTSNRVGISGVIWDAQIIPVRVLSFCYGADVHYAAGIIWAADNAQIANSSLQYYTAGQVMHDALNYAAAKGLIMVAAAGNWSSTVAMPASHPAVIAVAGTTYTGERGQFSNTGPELDLAAPGADVTSLHASGGYTCNTGTSMASPMVAAAAAMVLAEQPGASPARIRQILIAAAVDAGPPGHDHQYGWGHLDLRRVLRLAICYTDADCSGTLDTLDVQEFGRLHQAQHPYADFDGNGIVNEVDVIRYMNEYAKGCKPR